MKIYKLTKNTDLTHFDTSPRVLLRRLRQVMAEKLEAQLQLDAIVALIADNMRAEVCSVYVLRNRKTLELYATKGLNPGAVHNVSLNVGEGLVGRIAANAVPMNLNDAKKHPAFAFIPQTGEEDYNSFLGVPILRGGRSLGVLVVQNKHRRSYREEDVEALETTAMVIAELIAAGELAGIGGRNGDDNHNGNTSPARIKAAPFAAGIGIGQVVLHEPRVLVNNLFNDDEELEHKRLITALRKLRLSLDDMLENRNTPQHGETRDVLETYRMFANDRGWVQRMEEAITNGLSAEGAVEKVRNDHQARMQRIHDPVLRERLSDFDDLANRLIRELVGKQHESASDNPSSPMIVVARNMGAAELLDYDRKHLRGLILEDGGPASHVVIVAKALGIPVVGQVAGIVGTVENGEDLVIDGGQGVVFVRVGSDIVSSYSDQLQFEAKRQIQFDKIRNEPAVTRDGVHIDLQMNAGLFVDLPQLETSGGDGIGLFRTELQFMVSATFPRPGQQEALYRRVLDEAEGKPVTFRTLDVGGDKVLPYLRSVYEENPALGWRAVRLALDRPGLLKVQIRALLKAASGRELRVMLPMVTEAREVSKARAIIEHEMEILKKFGYELPRDFKLGAMIEVPSLLYQLDELMNEVDFVSVGSNDLFQFMTASDRSNAHMATRFDPVSRPFLRALRSIVVTAKRHDSQISICGEMAGRTIDAVALIAIGFRTLSMSSLSIGPVKSMVRSMDMAKLENLLLPTLDETKPTQTLREILVDFCDANSIDY